MSPKKSFDEGRSAFKKAVSLFPLQDPDPATDEAWELYTSNRLQAPRLVFADTEEDEENNELDIDKEFFYAIGYAMSTLEKEMRLKHNVLYKGYRMIGCDGYYPDGQKRDVCEVIGPENVNILSRIYSPTRPLYIDVHFNYRWLWGNYSIGFEYRIGFKIHPSPEKDDYNPRRLYEMKKGEPETTYNSNGWRLFAHGQNPEVRNVFGLDRTDIQDICDALWGPQKDLGENTDDKTKLERFRLLVNSVRVLLAAVGIHCKIACVDEEDRFTHWEIARIRDWICREIRNACGFQLKRDSKEVSQDVFVRLPYIESLDAEYEAIYDELYDEELGYDLF